MRITNTITANKVLLNINRNKAQLDTYYQQMASGKKIQYASENPIVASRALKFRTTVAETQQYQRNVQQGYSFLEISEIAVKNVTDMMERIRVLSLQGATGSLTDEDRAVVGAEIQGLIHEVGLQMNQTYAGRNVFSGTRTDEPAVFNQSTNKNYSISQNFNYLNINTITAHLKTAIDGAAELIDAHSIRLPYRDIEENSIKISMDTVNVREVVNANDDSFYEFDPHVANALRNAADTTYDTINGVAYTVTTVAYASDVPPAAATGTTIYFVTNEDAFFLPDALTNNITNGQLDITDGKIQAGELAAEVKYNHTLVSTNPDVFTTTYEMDKSTTEELLTRGSVLMNGGVRIDVDRITDSTSLAAAITANPNKIYYNEDTNEFYLPTAVEDELVNSGTPDANGNHMGGTLTFEPDVLDIEYIYMSSTDVGAYTPKAGQAIYLRDTGELILSDALKDALKAEGTGGFAIHYDKNGFQPNDLNPKTYFTCMDKDETKYTPARVYSMDNQRLQFEFGANVRIDVNSLAKDIYTPEMHADFAEFSKFIENVNHLSNEKDLREKYSAAPYNYQGEELDKAVSKQMSEETQAARGALQSRFQDLIASIDKYTTNISKQRTDIGSRMARLELIENRLGDDYVAYNSLLSENEDVDFIEVISNLSAMDVVYKAAMNVGAKLIQTSLVDFI